MVDPVIEGGKMVVNAIILKLDKEIVANCVDTGTPGRVVFTPEPQKRASARKKGTKRGKGCKGRK
jgi:hypothetical protein